MIGDAVKKNSAASPIGGYMKRIRLTVSYDGTAYCGWQVQPNGITIEEVLNQALTRLTGKKVAVTGASRTDAGVHARGNVAVFDTDCRIPPDKIAYALRSLLPEDIAVICSEEVPGDWHPRYQNSVKTYQYQILNQKMPDPLRRRDTWHVSFPLDLGQMKKAASFLTGCHDFKSFCSIHTGVKTTVRTIYELTVDKCGNMITIRISGNGFLYNMVRIIVGTLVDVGRGFCTPDDVKRILNAKNREQAGATAPAHGLVLERISYAPWQDEAKK